MTIIKNKNKIFKNQKLKQVIQIKNNKKLRPKISKSKS